MLKTVDISTLLRLLDDETEEVRRGVQEALLEFAGDASDDLAALGLSPASKRAKLLSKSLHPGRRLALREQWAVPQGSLRHPDGDWETFESLLRLLSDFLHDGVTLRASLSDELDQLTADAEPHVLTPLDLGNWLFKSDRFKTNQDHPCDPRNSDLAWVLQEGMSNPLGLSLVYILVAQRLGLQVFGINYPGHFLSLIDTEEGTTLIDPSHRGRPILVKKLLADHPEISQRAREAVKQPASLSAILFRLLANLNLAFAKADRQKDASLILDLMKTIKK